MTDLPSARPTNVGASHLRFAPIVATVPRWPEQLALWRNVGFPTEAARSGRDVVRSENWAGTCSRRGFFNLMSCRHRLSDAIVRTAAILTLAATGTAHAGTATSPWNGTWTLDVARSSPGSEGAAGAYRFTLRGKSIIWEIPSMGEVVTGRTDGRPMVIRRHGKSNGMTLSVTANGPATLRYRIVSHGKYFGGGVMMLVDDGKAWVDVTWGPPGPPHAAQLIYVRQPQGVTERAKRPLVPARARDCRMRRKPFQHQLRHCDQP